MHGQGWKEDKVPALFADRLHGSELQRQTRISQPPRCFLDAPKVDEMVRDIQANHGTRQENELPQLEELGLGKPPSSTPGPYRWPRRLARRSLEAGDVRHGQWAAQSRSTEQSRNFVWRDDAGLPRVRQDGGGGSISPQLSRRRKRGAFLGRFGSSWIWALRGCEVVGAPDAFGRGFRHPLDVLIRNSHCAVGGRVGAMAKVRRLDDAMLAGWRYAR